MVPQLQSAPREASTIPRDDLKRKVTVARPNEDVKLLHISVAGDTYTILVSGEDTAGRYCLVDMYIPPGGGPPPHRHEFEEMFTMLEGEIEFTFRGDKLVGRAGETINIPANAPQVPSRMSPTAKRLLCNCVRPASRGVFPAIGDPSIVDGAASQAQRGRWAERMTGPDAGPGMGTDILLP